MPGRSRTVPLVLFCLICLLTAPVSSAQVTSWELAWPMVGHDPQRTNRTTATVASHPRLVFSVPGVSEQPIVGPDGAVYSWTNNGLAAVAPSGTTAWTYRAWPAEGGPPVLAPDGTVYVNGLTGSEIVLPNAAIIGVGPHGRLASKLQPAGFSKGSPPAETRTGDLYLPYVGPTEQNSGLVVMLHGKRAPVLQPGFAFQSMAVGQNGSVYAVGRYSSHDDGLSIERLTPGGTVLWRHALRYDGGSVMVGLHGHVYVASGVAVGTGSAPYTQLSSYTAHGRLDWRHRPALGTAVLAQRADGVILAAGQGELAAYAASGAPIWRLRVRVSTLDAVPSIAVDATNTAFVGSGDGHVSVVSANGILEETLVGGPTSTTSAPQVAIGAEGRLIVVGTDSILRVYQ